MRNYHKKPPQETGKRIKYDIATLWGEPSKLEKRYRGTEHEPKQEKAQATQIRWGEIKNNTTRDAGMLPTDAENKEHAAP